MRFSLQGAMNCTTLRELFGKLGRNNQSEQSTWSRNPRVPETSEVRKLRATPWRSSVRRFLIENVCPHDHAVANGEDENDF